VFRKVTIVIRLVEESVEKTTEELEKTIVQELQELPPKIPYQEKIENVIVTEES
jgi:hypothetical protein